MDVMREEMHSSGRVRRDQDLSPTLFQLLPAAVAAIAGARRRAARLGLAKPSCFSAFQPKCQATSALFPAIDTLDDPLSTPCSRASTRISKSNAAHIDDTRKAATRRHELPSAIHVPFNSAVGCATTLSELSAVVCRLHRRARRGPGWRDHCSAGPDRGGDCKDQALRGWHYPLLSSLPPSLGD